MINQVIEVPNEASKFTKENRFRDALIRAVELDLGKGLLQAHDGLQSPIRHEKGGH